MIKIRLAAPPDIKNLVEFGIKEKQEKEILPEIPANKEEISYWFAECIISSGNYVFLAEENGEICGFLVLSEMQCPWNSNYRYLTDLMFLARKGGVKLIRTAKKFAERKNLNSIVLSVSTKKDRSDKFLNHIGQYIGGAYEIKV